MFNGSEEDRKAILRSAEVVGQLAKYSFVAIAYLGIAVSVSIKVGNRTIKTIKENVQNLKRKEGEVEC